MTNASAARITLGSESESRVATGVAVLDHLLAELARTGGFEILLEIAPAEPEAEVGRAGAAFGDALVPLLTAEEASGRGVGIVPADEALAMVVVEASGTPLVASNADLSSTKAGGLQADLVATFLHDLAESAGLTIHVRLMEGENSQHVLSAIFKALGVALARACSPP